MTVVGSYSKASGARQIHEGSGPFKSVEIFDERVWKHRCPWVCRAGHKDNGSHCHVEGRSCWFWFWILYVRGGGGGVMRRSGALALGHSDLNCILLQSSGIYTKPDHPPSTRLLTASSKGMLRHPPVHHQLSKRQTRIVPPDSFLRALEVLIFHSAGGSIPNPSSSESTSNPHHYPQQPAQPRNVTHGPVVPSRCFANVDFPPPGSNQLLVPDFSPLDPSHRNHSPPRHNQRASGSLPHPPVLRCPFTSWQQSRSPSYPAPYFRDDALGAPNGVTN